MVRTITDNQVDQQRATGARFQAADFGGGRAIAQGAQQLGQGLEDAGRNLAVIGQVHDEAAVKQADADDLKEIIRIRTEALASQGLEAPAKIKEAQEQIDQIQRARLSSFSNSRQRQMYSDVFQARNLQISEQFLKHSIGQVKEAEKAAAVSRAESYSDLAVDTYGTEDFDTNVQTSLNEVAVVNRGMAPEVIQHKQAELKSKILTRVISGMLSNPDNSLEASNALETNAKDILPDDETALRKTLNPILQEDQTEIDAGRAFSSAPALPEEEQTEPDPLAPAKEATGAKPERSTAKFSPSSIVGNVGRVTNTAQQHRARGSGNGLDIAAPEGTAIRPPMSGKVLGSPFWTDKGGWQILIEHPNGYVSGYAHMRARPALEAGANVDNSTVIGSVGSTGHSSGPHVHFTVRQGKGGPKIDPEVTEWSNTTSPDKVSWKEGKLQKFEPEENQLGRALDNLYKIAEAENWSPRRYQRAVDRARQMAGLQEQVYNQNKEATYNTALKTVAELGDGLTSVSQVPNYADLKPQHQITIQNIIKGNKSGANNPDAASADFFRYYDMALNPNTREEFSKTDLLSNPNLTNGERKQLFAMQWEVRTDKTGKLSADLDEASSMANRFLPKSDFSGDKGTRTRQRFQDAYLRQISKLQQGNNRQLTDQEKLDVARSLTVQAVRYQRTPEGEEKIGKTPMFEYEGPGKGRAVVDYEEVFNDIPPETVQRLGWELKRKGQPYNKQAIVRAFIELGRR